MKKILSVIILSGISIGAFASKETNICIQNPSTEPFYVTVSGINEYNWEDGVGPGKNFNNIAINPGEIHCQREEVFVSSDIFPPVTFNFVIHDTDGGFKNSNMLLNDSGLYWMSEDFSPLIAQPGRNRQDKHTEGYDCPAKSGNNCRLFKIEKWR